MNRKEKVRLEQEPVKKRGPRNRRRRKSLKRRLTAVVCVLAIWFSFNLGDSLQAAQSDHWISVAPVVSDAGTSVPQAVGVGDSLLATSFEVAIIATSIITLTLIGYSLLTTGKRGWGWVTLGIAGGILMVFVRLATALFREISSDNGIQDWDT